MRGIVVVSTIEHVIAARKMSQCLAFLISENSAISTHNHIGGDDRDGGTLYSENLY